MDLPIRLHQTAETTIILSGSRVYKIHANKEAGVHERDIVRVLGEHAHLVQWLPGGAGMVWAAGGDLDRRGSRVSEAWALHALAQLASALAHIQSKGLVHTRVTPCHVLIDADTKTVRLTGLRACVPYDATASVLLREAPFAAPELLAQDEVDASAVIDRGAACHAWALAITILIALFGHSPWPLALPACANFATWTASPTAATLARLCGADAIAHPHLASALCSMLAVSPSERLKPQNMKAP